EPGRRALSRGQAAHTGVRRARLRRHRAGREQRRHAFPVGRACAEGRGTDPRISGGPAPGTARHRSRPSRTSAAQPGRCGAPARHHRPLAPRQGRMGRSRLAGLRHGPRLSRAGGNAGRSNRPGIRGHAQAGAGGPCAAHLARRRHAVRTRTVAGAADAALHGHRARAGRVGP
ncbi:hypothetical protein OY671_010723, partial [Metschnikowia pulcherrima]